MSTILGRVANGVKKTFVVIYTSTLAKNSVFDPTGTSLSSTNAEDAIKEVDGKVDRGSVSVTADGVKTFGQNLIELCTLMDFSKIGKDSILVYYGGTALNYYALERKEDENVRCFFTNLIMNDNYTFNLSKIVLYGSSSTFAGVNGGSSSDYTNNVMASGRAFTLYY